MGYFQSFTVTYGATINNLAFTTFYYLWTLSSGWIPRHGSAGPKGTCIFNVVNLWKFSSMAGAHFSTHQKSPGVPVPSQLIKGICCPPIGFSPLSLVRKCDFHINYRQTFFPIFKCHMRTFPVNCLLVCLPFVSEEFFF